MSERTSFLRSGPFWLAATAICSLLYWFCLSFWYPGYFAPIAPFHVDFYDCVAAGGQSFLTILEHYPRPVSFMGMKLVAYGGLTTLMVGCIVTTLLSVLLTAALVSKVFELTFESRSHALPLLAGFSLYTFLLFAHPQFYIEHRHDFPAIQSYLFLVISLLAWVTWVKARPRANPLLLVLAATAALLFVLSKETYFAASLCLVAGFALADRPNRWRHAGFLVFLLVLEVASFAWNGHVNGPFVNAQAGANDPYHISIAPLSVLRVYCIYLMHLLNPALVMLTGFAVVSTWRDRSKFILAAAFPIAGIAVFATHAVLPNHIFVEYSWAAAPLFLAPLLLLPLPGWPRWKYAVPTVTAVLTVLAVAGPWGYRDAYRSDANRWFVSEDRKGERVASSIPALEKIPRPARVLVTGLASPMIPWESVGYMQYTFGDRVTWGVVLPPEIQYRRSSKLVEFLNASDVRMDQYDYVASYRASGSLIGIRPIAGHETQDTPRVPVRIIQGVELEARPAHIVQPDGTGKGVTEIFWKAPGGIACEIHVNAPDGPLFAAGAGSGHARTDKWVTNGMTFFLQDVSRGKALSEANTLARIKVDVTP